MKKLFLFFALLAGIAVMTGCQKEQDFVTLKAIIDPDTKAYFGTNNLNVPYWDVDDKVKVAGEGLVTGDNLDQSSGSFFSRSFGLTNPDGANATLTTFATITGVPIRNVYCAIYPANVVEKIGSPSASGTTATIYFDPHQEYIWDATNNRQRVNMPMGAVTTSETNTFYFKNLSSILRMKVKNQLTTDFAVKRLTVTSFGGYVAGSFDVTLSETNDPVINRANLNNTSEDNTLTLHVPDYLNTAVISPGESMFFDIVVPPFDAEYVILEAEMYNIDGSPLGYSSDTVGNSPGWSENTHVEQPPDPISLDRNKIVTLDLNVNTINRVIKYDYGYLIPGPDFNDAIRRLIGTRTDITITTISFNREPGVITQNSLYSPEGTFGTYPGYGDIVFDTVNNHPEGWVEVQTIDSPHKIWAYIDGTTVKINSWATLIYANTNCSEMFKNLPTISNIQWNTTREYGFQTEDVTDMSYMFAGNTNLSTITSVPVGEDEQNEVLYFNTTNVTNMAHMFDGCSTLRNLTLSFNTHNVKDNGMVAMFKNCSGLQVLNINSFTTGRITNMTDLFNGCANMKDLSINNDQFVISDGTTLTNMCTGLASSNNISQWDRCAIRCKVGVKDKLLSQDENHNYITGIDRLKVYFPNQGENSQGGTAK